MIRIAHFSVNFIRCFFRFIFCNGDEDNSSLITYVSSGVNHYTMKMNSVSIQGCLSNGDFITVKGENSDLEFNKVTIKNNISYGPFFNNLSKKVY